MQPAFHRDRIGALTNTIVSRITSMLTAWQTYAIHSNVFDVAIEMASLAREIIVSAMFSTHISSADGRRIHAALSTAVAYTNLLTSALPPMPLWVPTAKNRLFLAAIKTLDAVIYQIIEERRENRRDTHDLLSMLIGARDEESGAGMSDQQLHDEVKTIFIAGHETTANAMAWALYLIALHPEVEQRVYDEALRVFGQRQPTVGDLPKLIYTRRVLDETLRLYPSAWLIDRAPLVDDVIDGYHIPKGTILFISPYVMHRLPNYWDRAEVFDPDRFAVDGIRGHHHFTYLPFGGGPRRCLGEELALVEAQLAIAMIAHSYRLHLHGYEVVPQAAGSLRPQGLTISITRR
jgi:cytochrome P450